MIYVTMRDGRTIRYNNCRSYIWNTEANQLKLNITDNGTHIASLNLDLVERVEYIKPCAIHDKNGKQIKVKY